MGPNKGLSVFISFPSDVYYFNFLMRSHVLLHPYLFYDESCDLLYCSNRERRDANRRRPGDVNYDPRTLYLPPNFLKSLTGGQVILLYRS